MSFNIGDKVRATQYRHWGSVPAGTTGVVTELFDGGPKVDFGSHGDWWYDPEDLEMVEEVTEEQFVDFDLRNNPWQDYVEHNGYHGREAQLHYHIDRNLGDKESQTRAKELLAELHPEDTRSSTQPDTRSEMNRKMDTVREAGERRRQKLIAHTHKLEAVIRDRNAEIETLRAALSKVAQVASDEAYKNIPMHTYPF